MAAAKAYGELVAAAVAAREPPPAPVVWEAPLRNNVWAAVGGEQQGFYSKWSGAAEKALATCTVRGWPSLAEARAFAEGVGFPELADRR